MTIPRIFEPGLAPLKPGVTFTPKTEVLHYLRRVLRLKPGDCVLVMDGGPDAWQAVLHGNDSGLGLKVEKMADDVRVVPDGRDICVLVPVLKGDRTELAVLKATELGVTGIRIYYADRSIPRPSGRDSARADRFAKVAEEASRQCDRASIPEVSLHRSPAAAIADLELDKVKYILSEIGTSEPLVRLASKPGPVVLGIGPEGSFTDEERAMLLRSGFQPAGLGPRILKAETAVIASVAAVQFAGGDMG